MYVKKTVKIASSESFEFVKCLIVRINLPLFSIVLPSNSRLFLSYRPFVDITAFSTGLVGVEVTPGVFCLDLSVKVLAGKFDKSWMYFSLSRMIISIISMLPPEKLSFRNDKIQLSVRKELCNLFHSSNFFKNYIAGECHVQIFEGERNLVWSSTSTWVSVFILQRGYHPLHYPLKPSTRSKLEFLFLVLSHILFQDLQ